MLYQLGHGKRIRFAAKTRGSSQPSAADSVNREAVSSMAKTREWKTKPVYPVPTPNDDTYPGLEPRDVFRYLCKDAPEVYANGVTTGNLDALASAMAEAQPDQKDPAGESTIPPIFTYLGQFIDHDMTANTDREEGDDLERFNIDKAHLEPQSRHDVEKFKLNLRKGTLGLDSVYGDGPGQTPTAEKLETALRDPADTAKMRIGSVTEIFGPFERSPLPADPGADLPRVGQAIDDGALTLAEVAELFQDPENPLGEADLRRVALIGDGRNDENLVVAQTHLSFLRLHNAIVDELRDSGAAPGDNDALFAEARKQTTWTYQWLVTNSFLKAICDPDIVDQVVAEKAPVYQHFFDANKDDVPEGARPMPLEFSVAAYRYGHSMVRGDYDYNRNFGRGDFFGPEGRATFDQLFQFTGGGGMAGLPTLPDNWIIEWDRFTGDSPMENRVARKIDTRLALPLRMMRNNMPGMSGIMNHLAARNLRRGYLFNLPDAQGSIASVNKHCGTHIDALTPHEIASGPTGDAVKAGGFDTSTPLWFYVLKEAELKSGGEHLGPLGSRIVAETIVGLMVTDDHSYLNQGAYNSWKPSDGVQPNGQPIDTMSAMLRAGGLLGAPGV